MGTRESEDEDDPLSNTLVPPSASDALDLERQRLDIERQKLALERERLELDKLSGAKKSTSSARLPKAPREAKARQAKARAAGPTKASSPAPWVFLAAAALVGGGALALAMTSQPQEREHVLPDAPRPVDAPEPVMPAPPEKQRIEPEPPPAPVHAEAPSREPERAEPTAPNAPSVAPAEVAPIQTADAPAAEPPSTPAAPEKPKGKSPAVLKAERAVAQRIIGWLAERRTLECPTCHGKVMLKCSACSGSGKISVVEVGNGADPVTKVYDCSTCKTKGIVHCWKCENGLSEITTRSIEKRWRISGPWLGSYVEKSVKVEIAEDGKAASARYTIRLANTDRETSEDSSWELDAKGVWQGVEIVVPKKKLKADGQK